jgi:hypothetical protein
MAVCRAGGSPQRRITGAPYAAVRQLPIGGVTRPPVSRAVGADCDEFGHTAWAFGLRTLVISATIVGTTITAGVMARDDGSNDSVLSRTGRTTSHYNGVTP